MGAKTEISWTDATWSPLRARVKKDAAQIAEAKGYTSLIQVAGKMAGHVGPHCERVSHGCDHCYSDTNNGRCLPANGTGLPFDRRSRDLVEPFVDEAILLQPLKWRTPKKVFVENQSDLFGEWNSDGDIMRVFDVMFRAHQHTFQVLTKRPERMLAWMLKWADTGKPQMPVLARGPAATRAAHKSGRADLFASMLESMGTPPQGCAYPTYDWLGGHVRWPAWFPNVWLGVSCEDQATADSRIPLLLQTPAALRFVSYEPALGPINFRSIRWKEKGRLWDSLAGDGALVNWVIVGGESGPGARPFDVNWARQTVKQCEAAQVACFVKQLGRLPILPDGDEGYDWPDGTPFGNRTGDGQYNGRQIFLKDRKGGDMEEWAADLRIRQFPEARAGGPE